MFDTKKVEVSSDDFDIIMTTKIIMNVNESKAVRLLMEIGIENIIAYPTGITRIDKILSEGRYKNLVDHIQNVWSKLQ